MCPDTLAENSVKWHLQDLEVVMNLAGVARLPEVIVDQGCLDGSMLWWLNQLGVIFVVPANGIFPEHVRKDLCLQAWRHFPLLIRCGYPCSNWATWHPGVSFVSATTW
jgi:hypothetical protein